MNSCSAVFSTHFAHTVTNAASVIAAFTKKGIMQKEKTVAQASIPTRSTHDVVPAGMKTAFNFNESEISKDKYPCCLTTERRE